MNKEEYDIAIARNNDITDALNYANSNITYTDIKGKKYAEVKERIAAFRRAFPEGAISTKIVEIDDKHCIVKAEVFNENGSLLGQGHASETIGGSNINRTSMLENCETSAVGRALGMCGIGIQGAVASAQEVQRVGAIEEKRNQMLVCHRCGRPIIDAMDKSGKVWKAEEISKNTVEVYGDSLCFPCLVEIKKSKTEMEEAHD